MTHLKQRHDKLSKTLLLPLPKGSSSETSHAGRIIVLNRLENRHFFERLKKKKKKNLQLDVPAMPFSSPWEARPFLHGDR